MQADINRNVFNFFSEKLKKKVSLLISVCYTISGLNEVY